MCSHSLARAAEKVASQDSRCQVGLPSSVVSVAVNHRDGRQLEVLIPRQEIHRLWNIFQKEEYSLPKEIIVKSPLTVVDVGANVGAFALYAKGWADEVNIFCFEPNPQVVGLLYKNLEGCGNANVFNFALSNIDGEITLYQHPRNTGQSSITRVVEGGTEVTVPVRRAETALHDAGVGDIDVLKIDTEGSEVAILKGLGSYLERTSVVMLEYHNEHDRREIDSLLGGFYLYSMEVNRAGIGTAKYLNANLFGLGGLVSGSPNHWEKDNNP